MQKGFGNSVQRIVAKDYSIKPQQKSINKIKEMLKLLIKKPKKKSGSSQKPSFSTHSFVKKFSKEKIKEELPSS